MRTEPADTCGRSLSDRVIDIIIGLQIDRGSRSARCRRRRLDGAVAKWIRGMAE